MSQLKDFTSMQKKRFWDLVAKDGAKAEKIFQELWTQASERHLTPDEACDCLNALFLYSHKRILEHSKILAKSYPTKQCNKNRLGPKAELWWVDHFTAGISRWSTLNWFSSKKRKKKSGKMGFAGASTHFIQGFHGDPFYIIPLMHGSWNEPRRNKDSISIETVNAGMLHKDDQGKWCFWARNLPMDLVQELPPVLLDKPYRGCKVMQPFTRDQIINNIKLKRVVIAALHGKLEPCRMSQHSDWRQGKSDMGVLWPFEECNDSAYGPEPIPELDFIQAGSYMEFLDEEGTIWDEIDGWDTCDESDNPEYGELTPTHDDDDDLDGDGVYDTLEIQTKLNKKGYIIAIDGKMGPRTANAIKKFQADWNKQNPNSGIKVDGIPGPETCTSLFK
jgi:N-acetyl-anhydromuramyl-L-alanine amidase AmpD